MRELDGCDMEEFDALDNNEKTIAILGDQIDGGHRRPNRKGIRLAKRFYVIYGNNVMSAKLLEVSSLGAGTVLRLERDAGSMAK